jgi:methyl-accepting chemotaxis protein
MLRNITIQKRLLTAFISLALLLAITGFVSLQSLYQVRAQADIVETKLVPAISYLGAIESLSGRSRALGLRLLLAIDITEEGQTVEKIKAINIAVEKAVKDYATTISMVEERKVFEQFKEVELKYFELQQKSLELLLQEELGAAQDLLDQMNPLADQMASYLGQLSELNYQAVEDTRTESISTYRSAKLAVIMLIIIAIIIALAIALLISRSINQPLALAVASAQHIADGDLTRPLTIEGKDELSKLSKPCNCKMMKYNKRLPPLLR